MSSSVLLRPSVHLSRAVAIVMRRGTLRSQFRFIQGAATDQTLESDSGSANAETGNAEQPKPDRALEDASAKFKEMETKLSKEIEDSKKKFAELDDKYKRSLAETENVRGRLLRQIDDAKLFGIGSFCKDLLEVADVLQSARKFAPQEQIDSSPELKNAYDGISMTDDLLQKVFGKHGLEPVSPSEGDPFDPNFHEATFHMPNPNLDSDTIGAMVKIGYKLRGRLLRPAKVGVVKNN